MTMVPLVVTTINAPTPQVHALAQLRNVKLIVIGDQKTPSDWALPEAKFVGYAEQLRSEFALAAALPLNHYCRKNLGYLYAMQENSELIAESDDDNAPTVWPIADATESITALVDETDGWTNVYRHFTDERIWPRGFPLELLTQSPGSKATTTGTALCSVQQYLAEGDPDVDAVYRLTLGKDDHQFESKTVIMGSNALVPFNSQSTIWFREAFFYMYLPSFVSFRMTDIWRSFVAQVCLKTDGRTIAYHGRGVHQDRNAHNLLHDLDLEVVGYLRNREIVGAVVNAVSSDMTPEDKLRAAYDALLRIDVVTPKELDLVELWIADVGRVLSAS